MRPPVPTATGPATILLAAGLVVGFATGCGPDATPPASVDDGDRDTRDARARLAAHAAAAQDRAGVMSYDLTAPQQPDRTVMVVLGADGTWRVDVPLAALDGTTDVAVARTNAGLFHCALPTADDTADRDTADQRPSPGCVQVDQLDASVDPRVPHVFTDWLEVLTDRGAALAVTAAQPPDGVTGECFAVEHAAASLEPPLDAGLYCFDGNGTLTGARLGFGTLVLAEQGEVVLPTVELPYQVVDRDPVPLVAPPPPSPSPSASPSAPPAEP